MRTDPTLEMNNSSQDSSVTSTEETFRVFQEKPTSEVNLLVSRLIESALGQDGTAKPADPGPVEEESRLAKAFPWLTQFNKLCRAEIGTTNISTLENLMTVYLHNISSYVSECYLKPNRAAKLKRCMNDTLLLFHMFYSDIKKPLEHSSYLDKMSDLMAMYMDMEIKASRRGKESLPKIASKLTSSLYIFLDRSQDHILDSILKTKYMNKNFWELCVLIFSRVLRDSPGRAVYEMTYVRYVLAFKMWKRVVRGAEERRKVMKLATMKLFPPSQFREKLRAGLLSGVLPKIPKSRKDITLFLMQAKFCIKEKTKAFLKAVADPKQQGVLGSQLAADLDRPLFFGDDADNSYNSNSDEQEDTSGSSMLMNDIWSSMSLESGITDHLRLASVVTAKTKKQVKNKTRRNVIKCKGIATPVFKTEDPGDTESNASEKCKKKKKKPKDKTSDKPEDVTNTENESTVDRKSDITVCNSAEVVSEKESPPVRIVEKSLNETEPVRVEPEIPVANIKVEPESDDVCIIGYVSGKDKEQVNQVDSVCQGDKESEMLDVAEEVEIRCDQESAPAPEPSSGTGDLPCQEANVSSVKVESSSAPAENVDAQASQVQDIFLYDEQTPSVWSPAHQQGYYNNQVNDFINDYLDHSKIPDFDLDNGGNEIAQRDIYEIFEMNKPLNIKAKENLFPMNGDNVLNEIPSVPTEEEVSDTANRNEDLVTQTSNPPDDKSTFDQTQVQAQGLGNTDSSQIEERETDQELINKMIESLHEQGRYTDKNQVKTQKVTAEVAKAVPEVQAKIKEKGMLHDETLQRDHKIFISQQKFRSFYITQNIPPATPVPSPLEFDPTSMRPIQRCHCAQCYANQIALITNYRILTQYKNSKINIDAALRKSQNEELLRKIEESLKEKPIKDECSEPDSSLPLKKRKTFACNTALKKEEAVEPSYPCTPMMSIAALEENKANMKAVNYETKIHPGVPMDYAVANTSSFAVYSGIPTGGAKPFNTVIVHGTKPKVAENIVSGSYSPYPPPQPHGEDNRIRFKTPAQLKEGSTQRPTPEINAAHDLINFAQNSHKFYNTQPPLTDSKPVTRSRHKSKPDKPHSRKKRQGALKRNLNASTSSDDQGESADPKKSKSQLSKPKTVPSPVEEVVRNRRTPKRKLRKNEKEVKVEDVGIVPKPKGRGRPKKRGVTTTSPTDENLRELDKLADTDTWMSDEEQTAAYYFRPHTRMYTLKVNGKAEAKIKKEQVDVSPRKRH